MKPRLSVNNTSSPLGKKSSLKSSKNTNQYTTGKKSQGFDDLGALVDEMENGKHLERAAGRSD